MPLAPGPFNLQSAGEVFFQVVNYDFTDAVAADQAEIDVVGATIDLLMPDIEAFTAPTIDPVPGVDLNTLQLAIDPTRFDTLDGTANDIVGSTGDVDTALATAIAFAPTQAWVNPPSPFIPDLNLQLATPALTTTGYAPPTLTTSGTVPTQPGPTPTPPPTAGVSLLNLTAYGSPNFTVGDNFSLTVTGQPGGDVTGSAQFNGEDLGTTDFGTIDNTGKLVITGTMQPENAGAWLQSWLVNGQFVGSLNFIVLAGHVATS